MQLIIAGKPAALKENTSVEYVQENRFFTDADDYTLSITLPMSGCPENVEIFGHLTRMDVDNPRSVLDAEIRTGKICRRGVVTITEITQSAVKVQFLANRTVQNYATDLDEVWINELDLGRPASVSPKDWGVKAAWGMDSSTENYGKYVAIPWVNNSSGNVQNDVRWDAGRRQYMWHEDTRGLSFMPYMLEIAKRVAEAIGFSADFSPWEETQWRWLLCCSALPWAWNMPDFADALPHWSVRELFAQLENLMGCEFDFDFVEKKIGMSIFSDRQKLAGAVLIEDLVDEYSVSVESKLKKSDIDKSYLLTYPDKESKVWRRYTCDWMIEKCRGSVKEVTADSEWAEIVAEYNSPIRFYMEDEKKEVEEFLTINPCPYIFHYMDTYWIVECGDVIETKFEEVGEEVTDGNTTIIYKRCDIVERRIVPVAMFAAGLSEEEQEDATTIDLTPAILDYTDMGRCVFLECGTLDNADVIVAEDSMNPVKAPFRLFSQVIDAGKEGDKEEYVSGLSVAFAVPSVDLSSAGRYYCPAVDWVNIDANGVVSYNQDVPRGGLRLRRRDYSEKIAFDDIDLTQKYTFKFLAQELPDVRAVYYIHGKRYVCESLTATLTERGMSELIKGVFYRITE